MCLFRGVSHAFCDEGPHVDLSPWKQLFGVVSQKHAPSFTSVTVTAFPFLFLIQAILLS